MVTGGHWTRLAASVWTRFLDASRHPLGSKTCIFVMDPIRSAGRWGKLA
jgi:hypothetical protein